MFVEVHPCSVLIDGTAHGGSVILLENKIKRHEAHKFQTTYIEATNVIIEDKRSLMTLFNLIILHITT